eukprot:CAMPEP_0198237098 /NCGR_PEP_ID=MMETSP1446-20131203/2949_1 /TAXON_ID=1461542 ORGANISM="Unidentified sp, Strain CCMP2111" /NCGR_SAMPLE_ID=MMETSP1446 /ASSEMBLY_ACC=CAM_ASM_001112 /LENGTH=270 /DNA_ID=CAMNT_0043919125 /DNA_START=274 /DNA_END=1086 /DNA_ORIENTATION=+
MAGGAALRTATEGCGEGGCKEHQQQQHQQQQPAKGHRNRGKGDRERKPGGKRRDAVRNQREGSCQEDKRRCTWDESGEAGQQKGWLQTWGGRSEKGNRGQRNAQGGRVDSERKHDFKQQFSQLRRSCQSWRLVEPGFQSRLRCLAACANSEGFYVLLEDEAVGLEAPIRLWWDAVLPLRTLHGSHGVGGMLARAWQFALPDMLGVQLQVMYDAAGVRRQAGRHAEVLNAVVDELKLDTKQEKKLKEVLGHSKTQVFFGAVLGLAIGLLVK